MALRWILVAAFLSSAFAQPPDPELQQRTAAIRSSTTRGGEARRADILWIIEHHPEAPVLQEPIFTISPEADPEGYTQARALWQKVTKPEDTRLPVLSNAAAFFISSDPHFALDLLRRARARDASNILWPARIGQVYAFAITGISAVNRNGLPMAAEADPALAERWMPELLASTDAAVLASTATALGMQGRMALRERGAVLKLIEPLILRAQQLEPKAPNWHIGWASMLVLEAQTYGYTAAEQAQFQQRAFAEYKRALDLGGVLGPTVGGSYMRAAVETGHLDEAEAAARACLKNGSDAHHCNLILGRVALRRGDLKAAGAFLIAAGEVPGGGVLSSFGPNMMLAKELLEKDQRDVVLRYLTQCERLWTMHPETLRRWASEVKVGKIPDFGTNLVY